VYARVLLPPGEQPDTLKIIVNSLDASKRFVSWGIEGTDSFGQNSRNEELAQGAAFKSAVPVVWIDGKPQTRKEPWDNFRVIQLERNGGLLQLEIGIATRGDNIFLVAQEQFRGKILAGSREDIDVRAAQSRYAYPGFPGYTMLWTGILTPLGRWMNEWGITPNGRYSKVKWFPGPNPYGENGAVVLFSSPVGGAGRLMMGVDGEILFFHFRAIDPKVNSQLALSPMTWVNVLEIRAPQKRGQNRQAARITV